MKKAGFAAAFAAALLLAPSAQAQTWNAEQSSAWSFISSAWERHADPGTWHEVLDENGLGWNTDYPMPTNRGTMSRYARAFGAEGQILYHRLDPVGITVSGDTAIVLYFAQIVETNHAGVRKTMTEQCADTLIRRSGQWRFLGWLCRTTTQP